MAHEKEMIQVKVAFLQKAHNKGLINGLVAHAKGDRLEREVQDEKGPN